MAEAAPGSDDAKRELAPHLAPAEAVALLRELDPDHGLMRHFLQYWDWLGQGYHVLGDYEQELAVAREGRRRYPEHPLYVLLEARALAALGRLDDVAAQIEAVRSSALQDRLGQYLLFVSVYLETHGQTAAATETLEEAIAWARSRPTETEDSQGALALSLYHARRWEEARELFETLVEEYPRQSLYLAALGWLAARRGDRAEALLISQELGRCDRQRCGYFPPGTATVYRAEIAALLGDRDEAVGLLREVLGISFSRVPALNILVSPHYHLLFESLRGYPPFEELIRPNG
jgi:tetratricopeptide (TPR) repeat protein